MPMRKTTTSSPRSVRSAVYRPVRILDMSTPFCSWSHGASQPQRRPATASIRRRGSGRRRALAAGRCAKPRHSPTKSSGSGSETAATRTSSHAADRELLIPYRPAALCGACGEVVGPVTPGIGDPADCGVDVHAEQVSQDGGGEVGGEGGECSVAGGPGADAMAVEPGGEAVVVDRLSGDPAGKQPVGSLRAVVDHEPGWWLGGQRPHERAEAGGKQDRVLAGGQVGVVVLGYDVIGAEVPDALGLEAEQEDERACGPHVDGQGVIGQAPLQQVPAFVIAELFRRLLAWDVR